MSQQPVILVTDDRNTVAVEPKKKRARTDEKNQNAAATFLRPESSTLLDDMLYPMSTTTFLKHHFRKDAVCINRKQNEHAGNDELVSYICNTFLFGMNVKEIFAETSSENVFLWLRPPPSGSSSKAALNSVEISDPESAFALHRSGSHPAYCRAPPALEQLLVGSLLRSTGLGGGHYHPPHADDVTVGGGTTLGRGEVELFISTSSSSSKSKGNNGGGKKHLTGWHTDFQENFTIQLSGVKKWTLRRGRVSHPLRATTPHYAREGSVIENQLKVARLSCMSGTSTDSNTNNPNPYGFEYDENNTFGPEQTITLHPGDCFYFPSGMWHKVETVEPGISLNVSLMGTTYAKLVSEALQHLLVGSDDGWREIVTSRSRPGQEVDASNHLDSLMSKLPQVISDFVNLGGAQSVLPPALTHLPIGNEESGDEESDDENIPNGGDEDEEAEDNESVEETEEDESDDGKSLDEDTPTSGIIIPMDDFVGPQCWSCEQPPKTKLIKNPLATLIAMDDITQHLGTSTAMSKDEGMISSKKYILNVNYAGNDMYESYIRVILETEKFVSLMESCLTCEANGGFDGDEMNKIMAQELPPCLFYYGYLQWVKIE